MEIALPKPIPKSVRCLVDVENYPITRFTLLEDRGYRAAQTRRLLFEKIAQRANADGTSSFPGDTLLQKLTGASARNLPRLRKQLHALGLLNWQVDEGKKIVYTVTVEQWPKPRTISRIFSRRTPAIMDADPCHYEAGPLPSSQPTPAMNEADPCHGEHPDPCQIRNQVQQTADDRSSSGPATVPSLPSHRPSPPTATANSKADGGGFNQTLTAQKIATDFAEVFTEITKEILPVSSKAIDMILRLLENDGEDKTRRLLAMWLERVETGARSLNGTKNMQAVWTYVENESASLRQLLEAENAQLQRKQEQDRIAAEQQRSEAKWFAAYQAADLKTVEAFDTWIEQHPPIGSFYAGTIPSWRRDLAKIAEAPNASDEQQAPEITPTQPQTGMFALSQAA